LTQTATTPDAPVPPNIISSGQETPAQRRDHSERLGWQVKGYRAHSTHDGVAYTCSLYERSKKVGSIENSGRGGEDFTHFNDAAARTRYEDLAQALALDAAAPLSLSVGDLNGLLISGFENNKVSKTKVLLRSSKTDALGMPQLMQIKGKMDKSVMSMIRSTAHITDIWLPGTGWVKVTAYPAP